MEFLTHEIYEFFDEIMCFDYERQTFVPIVAAYVYSHHHVSVRDISQKERICFILCHLYVIPESER